MKSIAFNSRGERRLLTKEQLESVKLTGEFEVIENDSDFFFTYYNFYSIIFLRQFQYSLDIRVQNYILVFLRFVYTEIYKFESFDQILVNKEMKLFLYILFIEELTKLN